MSQTETDERKLVGARVTQDVREQIFDLARREDRSVSSIVRRALVREIERDLSNALEKFPPAGR